MKKLLTFIISMLMILATAFSFSCGKPKASGLSFYCPDGAPALAIAKCIEDNESFGTLKTVNYNVVAADKIGGSVQTGKADMVILPVNAASKLYKANASDPYKMVAVVTHGNLYVMSTTEITINDLANQTIGVIGQGLVPDLTLKAVLSKNSIDYNTQVNMTYYGSGAELLPALKQGVVNIGLVPEPAATNLETKVAPNKTWYRLNLAELYDSEANAYPQAVLMVKESVLNAYPGLATVLEQKLTSNVDWAKENVAKAVNAVNSKLSKGVVPSLNANAITAQVISNCGIYFEKAVDAKTSVMEYINNLIKIEPTSARAITNDFFYGI
jgi:NitT/TauT family transport system substrate-binding protein